MSDIASRRIHVLRDSVARKIAAGEVIDRPFSVIRELLDNSLDAGCSRVEVILEAGGLQSIQVVDDGFGMNSEDLELCWLPHTTSKIETEDDLNRLSSLGFRGEALASVAACSRLQITSATDHSGLAFSLTVEEGRSPQIKKTSGIKGTRVRVDDLFYNIPARKKFLKTSAAEGTLCRRVFEEKALAFPNVAFQLRMDGQLKANLPAQNLTERLLQLSGTPWSFDDLLVWETSGNGFSIQGFALKPPLHRSDRKGIRIYANKRPLQEYALVQATSYAFEGFLPGGAYPWATVFLEVEPSLVDFNIHPAKREARFRSLPEIHKTLVEGLRDTLNLEKLRSPLFYQTAAVKGSDLGLGVGEVALQPRTPSALHGRAQLPSVPNWDPGEIRNSFWSGFEEVREKSQQDERTFAEDGFRYLGQVLGVFLIAEVGETLYLIDQHAAHERILFDRFRGSSTKTQELLIPARFEVDEEALPVFFSNLEAYAKLGIGIHPIEARTFEIWKLPELVSSMEKEIVEFIRDCRKPPQHIEKDLYASLSCRAAVMDGDPLAPATARNLIRQTLGLDNARCPHGRPIWTTLTRQQLFEKVGRVV